MFNLTPARCAGSTDERFCLTGELPHEARNTRFDWFWKLHRTHHSAKYTNVTMTMRVDPFWSVVAAPAVLFSFIDRLFGTLHIPEERPSHHGLPGENAHWAEETLFPLYRRRPTATVAATTESR